MSRNIHRVSGLAVPGLDGGENVAALAVIGWESLIVWECETADAHSLKNRLKTFIGGKYQ